MKIANVEDRRHGWIGEWTYEALEYDQLTQADVGRTVIYLSHNKAEAGTLVFWRNGIVFARYSTGDTAAGADPADLVFGLQSLDNPKLQPPSGGVPL